MKEVSLVSNMEMTSLVSNTKVTESDNRIKKTRTIRNLLLTALEPMGKTLYIYGGGWNLEDTGAGIEARTIGVSPKWKDFFQQQNADYRYRGVTSTPASIDHVDCIQSAVSNSKIQKIDYYPHDGKNRYGHLGLDCSGYIGWLIYNVMNTESGGEGYVVEASKGAKAFAERFGLGTWGQITYEDYHTDGKAERYNQTIDNSTPQLLDASPLRPGDIISISGHIWLYVGACNDGSIVLLHSSVTKSRTGAEGGGVQFSVLNPMGDDRIDCQAYQLIEKYVSRYLPEWHSRYEVAVKPWKTYLSGTLFHWNENILSDPDGYHNMTADKILADIFKSYRL